MRVTTRLGRNCFALLCLLFPALLLIDAAPARAQVNVLTQHNDNGRTGGNLGETTLTTTNVNAMKFGKLFTRAVDAEIYAQPLYVSGVTVPGKGKHNIVYVATMNNTVYAYDADDPAQSTPLWSVNLGPPVPAGDVQCCCPDISVQVGILSTPVIDPATNTLYLVSRNKNSDGSYHQWLNALDITTGAVKIAPTEITATYQSLTFDPRIQNQRPALTLANGNIYIAWASHNDCGPYHGWVISYSATTLQQNKNGVYVDTPTGGLGGIWMSGQGLTVDSAGSVYFSSGNGSWAPDGSQTGNSFVKLGADLTLKDWFTPYNSDELNAGDTDLGSAGLLGIPGTPYVISGGKQGVLYLVDTNNMTHFHAGSDTVRQEFQGIFGSGSSHLHGSPIYYNSPINGPTVFVWGENDTLRAYQFDPTAKLFNTTAIHQSAMTAPVTNANGAMPGGFLSVSSNNGKAGTGIIWAATPYNANANNAVVPGIVHAFNESTLQELWNDKQNEGRDDIGNFAKNVSPTVANGKVFMASFGALGSTVGSGQLVVYGVLPIIPDFTLKVTDRGVGLKSVNLSQGTSTLATVTVAPVNGFHGTVALSVSNLPAGVTAVFETNPTSSTSGVTFTASAGAATGTQTVKLTGVSGNLSRTTTLALVVTAAAPSVALTLTPTADTYARDGAYAVQNYGKATQLIAKLDNPNWKRTIYLKFDLSALPSQITQANLRLYGNANQTASSPGLSVYAVANTTWTETGLTWNNKPALGAKLSTASVTGTPQYCVWNVTAYLQAQQAAGAKTATLAVTMDSLPPSRQPDIFNSRESAGNLPQLTLTVAPFVNYPNGFAGAGGLQLNGSAKISGGVLRLTDGGGGEAGSAFFAAPVNIHSFHTRFSFQLTNPNADGITFCVQGNSQTVLGTPGGGLGYGPDPNFAGGANIGKSAAIKFDLYSNTTEGINSTGLFTNGAAPATPSTDLTSTGIDLHSGDLFTVNISYQGTLLTVTETDTTTHATATQSYPVNLPSLVGGPNAYVGFTGGTGGLTATQDILSWTYGP